jgi:hypothetical protein
MNVKPATWSGFSQREATHQAVRTELRAIETRLEGLRAEWATIGKASALPPSRASDVGHDQAGTAG